MTADLDALDKLEREATPLIVEGSDGKEWSITGPTCRIMPVNMWAGTVNKFAFVKRHLDDCKEIQGCSEETGHVYDVVAVFPTIEAAREYVALRAEIVELREWVASTVCYRCQAIPCRTSCGGDECPPCRERARKEGK